MRVGLWLTREDAEVEGDALAVAVLVCEEVDRGVLE